MRNWGRSSSASASASSSASSSASTSSSASASSSAEAIPYHLKPIPSGISPTIKQPTDDIVQFTWIVAKNLGNIEYQCKLCNLRFIGQPAKVAAHFQPDFNTQRTKACLQIGNLPDLLKEQLAKAFQKRKRAFIDTCEPVPSRSISVQLASQGRPDADAAILQFLVSEGISPAIAQKSSFRNMLRKVSSSGSQYIPPKPHDFGLNSSRPGSIGGLGRVLSSELDRCRVLKSNLLQSISHVGGTICNDGAKWRKRSVINSTLMTSHGPFFAQSTDATGRFKDANYLLTDIKSAISSVGEENVFIVALDGACKKTLRLIWNDPQMTKIFPQRCSTHGCNLLVADIGKHFKWEIAMCVRLVKFVCNHDRIFAILLEMEGSLQLLGAVEARFASQIYSSERILADKDYIKTLFYDPRLLDYLRTAPQDQRAEHTALEEEFVLWSEGGWKAEGFGKKSSLRVTTG